MAVILDGKATSAQVRGEIATAARALTERTGVVPGLAVVIVGDDPASQVYVRNKRRACEQVGFYSEGFELPADTTQETLEALVDRLNEDDRIHGILVQLPLPRHLDAGRILLRIRPDKDVDAFAENLSSSVYALHPDSLPRYYREALVLHGRMGRPPYIDYADEVMETNLEDFMRLKEDNGASPREKAYRVSRMFADTYWYYYFFNN